LILIESINSDGITSLQEHLGAYCWSSIVMSGTAKSRNE